MRQSAFERRSPSCGRPHTFRPNYLSFAATYRHGTARWGCPPRRRKRAAAWCRSPSREMSACALPQVLAVDGRRRTRRGVPARPARPLVARRAGRRHRPARVRWDLIQYGPQQGAVLGTLQRGAVLGTLAAEHRRAVQPGLGVGASSNRWRNWTLPAGSRQTPARRPPATSGHPPDR